MVKKNITGNIKSEFKSNIDNINKIKKNNKIIRNINIFLFQFSILFFIIGIYKKNFLLIKDVGKGLIITIFFQIIDIFINKSLKIKFLNGNKYLVILAPSVAIGFYYSIILSKIKKFIN